VPHVRGLNPLPLFPGRGSGRAGWSPRVSFTNSTVRGAHARARAPPRLGAPGRPTGRSGEGGAPAPRPNHPGQRNPKRSPFYAIPSPNRDPRLDPAPSAPWCPGSFPSRKSATKMDTPKKNISIRLGDFPQCKTKDQVARRYKSAPTPRGVFSAEGVLCNTSSFAKCRSLRALKKKRLAESF